MKIISKTKENTGRQEEVDLLRGFTALIMIICHVGLYLGNSEDTGLYTFSDIIGSEFAAPVFMALMGISIVYSTHQKPLDFLKRGINLFILGYILNFFRSLLPMLIFGNINEWTSIEAFFVVDILQLAGLSFMFMALLTKLKLPSFVILLTAMVMVILNQFIMLPESIPWNSKVLTGLVNLFTPVTTWSCFPFLTWFFFPAFGLFFGNVLIRVTNKKPMYLFLLIVGLIGVLSVYINFIFLYPDYTSYYFGNNFYYMGIKNVLLTCFFIFFGLAFWYFIGKIIPKFFNRYLTFLSKHLNVFYLISWLIISLLMHLEAIFNFNLSVIMTVIVMILVIFITYIMTYLFIKVKTKIYNKKGDNYE